MEKDLHGQIAIVTGAAAGIGKGIAARFLQAGARVLLVDYHQANLEKCMVEFQPKFGKKNVSCLVADLSYTSVSVPAIIRKTLEEFGCPDILVNCAGIYPSKMSLSISELEWDQVFDLNVKGYFFMAQAVALAMIQGGKRGRILNITSTASEIARPGVAHYCASKAAIKMLTQVLALEWAKYDIRINALGPGLIETDTLLASLTTENARQEHQEKISLCPMERVGLLEEIAESAVFFVSEQSNYVTGQSLLVDGGYSAGRYFQSKR